MENKKILLYGGGALVLGAVSFFVWSFFQKTEIPNIQKEPTDDSENSPNSFANPFSLMPTDFEPIRKLNTQSDLDWLMNNVSKN